MSNDITLPVASIIIVAHNSLEDLQACLESLRCQDRQLHEIIVVDNASTDGTAGYVAGSCPHVRLIRNSANLGYGAGNNRAVAAASGRFLVFLNPDTTVSPGWLDPLLAPLSQYPDIGMTTAQILLASDPDRINACGNEVHLSGLTLCRGMGQPTANFSNAASVAAVSGAAFAVRREVFDELAGFDERFFLYMEDTDLSLRARLAGYRILFVPEAVVRHRYKLRFGPDKVFLQERNRYLMLLKVYRWRTLIVLTPALLAAEIVTWGFVLSRERTQISGKLRACAWPLQNWRAVAKARQATQRLRRASDHGLLQAAGHQLDFAQTGDTAAVHLADALFTPVFRGLRVLALKVVRW